jgi:hypothetical protein
LAITGEAAVLAAVARRIPELMTWRELSTALQVAEVERRALRAH